MKRAESYPLLGDLGALVREEEGLATSLIHASLLVSDPPVGSGLREMAKGCVEHARALRRHLGERPGPGRGPRAGPDAVGDGPRAMLEWAQAVARRLTRDYSWCTRQSVDRHLRVLLASLAEEHERLAREIAGLASKVAGQDQDVVPAAILGLARERPQGRRRPGLERARRRA